MFYVLSKLFWLFAQPINLIGLLLIAAIAALLLRRRRTGIAFAFASLFVLVLSVWTSFGALIMQPLEDRFARPDPAPAQVAGIIVLGGGFEGGVNLVRGGYELSSAGDRYVEAAVLARRYPNARIVVTGGGGEGLNLPGEADGDTAPRLLTALGVERGRLVLENRSRNTYENAVFSRELVTPKPGETWLLVTSAFHMPRSMGLFRKAGFEVVAWPCDYRTSGIEHFGLAQDNLIDTLETTQIALREWVGLAAYRLTGRIDTLLPSP